ALLYPGPRQDIHAVQGRNLPMLLYPPKRFRHLVFMCLLSALLLGSGPRAAEDRTFIQKPEVAPAQERTTAGGAAVPANTFQVLPGFRVERLFTVPKEKLGSWVCLTFDDKGRLLASDQDKKGICRITPPPLGRDQPTKVEHLAVKITAAQGMLHAF